MKTFPALLAAALVAQAGAAGAQAADERQPDVMITQHIRQSVMADPDLSRAAHNVKIVTVNGQVTLNGIVHSDLEKATIEAKAIDVAGADKVSNRLKVVPQS